MRLHTAAVRAACAALAIALVVPRDAGATVRTLFASGTAGADGVPLESLDHPLANAAGDVLVQASSSAVVRVTTQGAALVVGTGSALAVPPGGTLNRVFSPAVDPSGTIAVVCSVNGPSASYALLLLDGAGVTTVPAAYQLSLLGLNVHGDVLLERDGIFELRSASDGSFTPLAVFDNPRDAALGDDGTIALQIGGSTRARVLVGRAGGTFEPLVAVRDRIAGGELRRIRGLLVSPDGRVVVLAQVRGRPSYVVLSLALDAPAVEIASDVERHLGLAPDGSIVVRHTTKHHESELVAYGGGASRVIASLPAGATAVSPRIGAGNRVAWLRAGVVEARSGAGPIETVLAVDTHPLGPGWSVGGPEVLDDGSVVVDTRREGLYRLAGTTATPLLLPGMRLGDGARIDVVGPGHAWVGDVALGVVETRNRVRLVAVRDDGIATLLTSGKAAPGGRTVVGFDLLTFRSAGDDVLFEASVAPSRKGSTGVLRVGGAARRVRSVLGPGDRVGDLVVSSAHVQGGDGDRLAIVATSGRKTAILLSDGRRSDVAFRSSRTQFDGTLSVRGPVGGTPDLLLFQGTVTRGPISVSGLFPYDVATRTVGRRISDGESAPGGGGFVPGIGFTPIAGRPWFVGTVSDPARGYFSAIYEVAFDGIHQRIGRGTAVAGGGALGDAYAAQVLGSDTIVYGRQDDDGSGNGLYLTAGDGVAPLVVERQPSPLGGTLGSIMGVDATRRPIVFTGRVSGGTAFEAVFAVD